MTNTENNLNEIKKLIYYWYVHNKPWNVLYDIHIKLLYEYRDRFDEKEFIIATDPDTKQEYIDAVVNKIKRIMPDATFTYYENDKDLRESKYFYNEIATKLDQMGDRWYFFAHNKGVDSWYAPGDFCKLWIIGMYFMNLNFPDKIEDQMKSPHTCVIGTYLIRNVKAWPWLRYNWHFSGTFFWFNPKRICKVMYEKGTEIPSKNDRYFTESCWGTCIPDNEKYRRPALDRYDANWRQGFNWMYDDERKEVVKVLKR